MATRALAFALSCSLLSLTSCREPPPENPGACEEEGWFEAFLNDVPAPEGDLSCFTPGEWLTDEPDAACQVEASVAVTIMDYQDQEPVAGASVALYDGDDLDASARDPLTADESGVATTSALMCTPLLYRTTRSDGSALETLGPHTIIAPEEPVALEVQSVSTGSKGLLELTFQVEVAEENGSVVGRALDCSGEPFAGAQVIVRDDECQVPDSWVPGYFTNQLPDVFRAQTSDDGVWVAMDVPPGRYTVEMYLPSESGDGHVLAGAAAVEVEAGGASKVDVHLGRRDGISYPASCLSCP